MTDRVPLPDEDHFAKYFSSTQLIRDPPESANVVGVAPHAFVPRKIDDGQLSGNHLEFFTVPTLGEKVFALAKQLNDSRSLTVRRSGKFGVGQIAEIKKAAKLSGIEVSIVKDPIEHPPDPSHALMLGVPLATHLSHEDIAKAVTLYAPFPPAKKE